MRMGGRHDERTQPLARDAMAYVLAGGRGSRLKELTDRRAKPAVYFGGKTRIIDFALSNALNSGIRRIGGRDPVQGAFADPPPAARLELPAAGAQRELRHPAGQPARLRDQWYEGTADAVYQNIDIIEAYEPEYMVILAGDHIYKMDYELMLQPARRRRRRRHRRLPRSAAHGGDRLRRHACRREGQHHRLRREAGRSARHSRQAGPSRWPRWASTSSSTKFLMDAAAPRRRRPEIEPRLRQGHHPLHRQERQGGRPPLRQVLRALERRERGLLARRRHGRRLLGGQYRPDRHHARARPLRPRLADLDLCRD